MNVDRCCLDCDLLKRRNTAIFCDAMVSKAVEHLIVTGGFREVIVSCRPVVDTNRPFVNCPLWKEKA